MTVPFGKACDSQRLVDTEASLLGLQLTADASTAISKLTVEVASV
tara:strand:- start:312 stop:446 length:135 start_codon:yes stop_codon:yes gene_type:complete